MPKIGTPSNLPQETSRVATEDCAGAKIRAKDGGTLELELVHHPSSVGGPWALLYVVWVEGATRSAVLYGCSHPDRALAIAGKLGLKVTERTVDLGPEQGEPFDKDRAGALEAFTEHLNRVRALTT